MTYSTGHPVRLFGGRLALDFINTADWSSDGTVVHEKIASADDLNVWLRRAGLGDVAVRECLDDILSFRRALRDVLIGRGDPAVLNAASAVSFARSGSQSSVTSKQSFSAVIAASALSILADGRERGRLKMCPSEKCGWMFIDETKNARRTWCSMQTCGNRAKASRHYARLKAGKPHEAG